MPQRPLPVRRSLARAAQEAWAVTSHARALAYCDRGMTLVPVAALLRDAYPRALTPARAARMPVVRPGRSAPGQDCSLSTVAISPKADGAALLLLASPAACQRWQLQPRAHWLGAVSVGAARKPPCWRPNARRCSFCQRHGLQAAALQVLELHDAFAAQALGFAQAFGGAAGGTQPPRRRAGPGASDWGLGGDCPGAGPGAIAARANRPGRHCRGRGLG